MPKYENGCPSCSFLGHVRGQNESWDVYVCINSVEGKGWQDWPVSTFYHATILARYGDEGHEYASTSVSSVIRLLAERRELLPYEVAMAFGLCRLMDRLGNLHEPHWGDVCPFCGASWASERNVRGFFVCRDCFYGDAVDMTVQP